ncbi:PTS transporter subunit EIIC [Lachnospiraceae bacterium 54-53]
MTNEALVQKILELSGGKENVSAAASCMTRLRLKVKDPEKVKTEELKAAEGVLGLVAGGIDIQVVVGPGKARKLLDICRELGISGDVSGRELSAGSSWQENKAALKAGQKGGGFKNGIRVISDIFIPMIPAIIAAGLCNGVANIIGQGVDGKILTGSFWTLLVTMLKLFGGAFLGYFAIFTGINASKSFGATPALGGMIGAMSIMSQITDISKFFGLYNEQIPNSSTLISGKGGIIGVIVGVWVLSKVERWVRKHVPDVLDIMLTGFLSILITGTLFVLVLMPAAGFLSDGLVWILSLLVNSSNPVVSVLSGYIMSAVFLPLVLLGLHHGLVPIYAVQLEQMGGVSLFPVLAMAGAGQVGAAIAIYFKAKRSGNKRLKSVIIGALPSGFLGIGEPLIYGVTLPLGRPFITAGLGAGFGGAYVMLMHVKSIAWSPSGLLAIPIMSSPASMFNYFLGLVIAYIAGFIITSVFIREDEVAKA